MDRAPAPSIGMMPRRIACSVAALLFVSTASADGVLDFAVRDEATQRPIPSRIVVTLVGKDRPVHVRKCEPAGTGVILDRETEVSLRDGNYQFELIRGPEYRIIEGTFTLEKLSDDAKSVALPRMVDMHAAGWVSGDALVPPAKGDLPLRMAGEDLHVALLAEPEPDRAPRSPRRQDDPIEHEPIWIEHGVEIHRSLAIYGRDQSLALPGGATSVLLAAKRAENVRVAAANPFDWPMPVWLASGKLDGVFVMGDWLRTDRDVVNIREGRPLASESVASSDPGRTAEIIYHQMLEAGFEIPPIAGGGADTGDTPLGYNRVYSCPDDDGSPVQSLQRWQSHLWQGRTMLTNGPMLRCRMNDQLPGHRFEIDRETRFQIALELAVRDPVDYLDVIHNGKIFYSAPLDEFAESGGRLPPINTDQPGWVIVRVVTKHANHYRFAMSSPWYIHASGKKRITPAAVAFWQAWLKDYETRLTANPKELAEEARYIGATRKFWSRRLEDQQPEVQ